MINSIFRTILSLTVMGTLVLSGCSKDEEASAPAAAAIKSSEVLRYVPADTPYAFASLEPLPEDVLDSLEPKLDKMLEAYQAVLQEVVAAKLAEDPQNPVSDEESERAMAFVTELGTIMSIDGMRSAGIDRNSMGAFYGNGILPVARMELSDPALMEATIARLEKQAGAEMTVGEVEGQSYRYFDADDIRIIIAIVGDHAVFSVIPAAFDDAQVARVLGLEIPDRSLADSGVLEEIIGEYGLTNHIVGFVDMPKLAERFIAEPTGVDADLMALLDYDNNDVSDVCKAEIREFAGIMPRLVAGYTGIAVNRFDSRIVVELRDDIASGVQGLAAAVPGLGGDTGALMSFGFSLNVLAAREFIEARLDAMEADPYECEYFSDLQAGVASGRASLNQPVPPMVYDFRGMHAVIDEIEGLDIATETPPESVDGTFLLAMDNAQNLVNMGAMFSPELAALNLQPDGKPVALDLPQLQAMGMDTFAALSESALAISVGEGAEAQSKDALAAASTEPPPLISFSMDAARYYSFMGEAIAVGDSDDENAPTPEMKEAMNDMMMSIADLYDRMSGDVLLTEKGVEINMTETLKD